MIDHLIAEIRETHRMHQDLLRAELRLGQQIAAIERRIQRANGDLTPEDDCAPGRETIVEMTANVYLSRVNSGGIGHICADNLISSVDATNPIMAIGHRLNDDPKTYADGHDLLEGDADQTRYDDQWNSVGVSPLFAATLPLQEARAGIRKHQLALRRRMEKLAKQLPVVTFVENVSGFGWFGCAQIIGETGDLRGYANPAKVWKRMGLAVIDGQSQRRVAGAAALEHGYAPHRRTIMHVIGESLIKKQNLYRDLYLARKEYETAKAPALTKLQWHRRAMRYIEKRLLRDLWRAWRDAALDSATPNPSS